MIRLATIHDIDEAEKIYEEVLDYEAVHGTTTNWVKGKYPTRATAKKALAAGTYYVGEDENGRIFGTVNLNHIQPAEYGNIPWTMEGDGEEVLVVQPCVFALTAEAKAMRRILWYLRKSWRKKRDVRSSDWIHGKATNLRKRCILLWDTVWQGKTYSSLSR